LHAQAQPGALLGGRDSEVSDAALHGRYCSSFTGVLLQGSGALFPLGNSLSANEIRRNRVDVLVSGARATRFVGNSISAIGERTAILFAIGNTSGLGGPR